MINVNETLHYRNKFEIAPGGSRRAMQATVLDAVWNWVVKKEARREGFSLIDELSKPKTMRSFRESLSISSGYQDKLSGPRLQTASFQRSDGALLWAMDYNEPDSFHWFRRWHTRLGIVSEFSGACLVNIAVGYYNLPEYIGGAAPAPSANVPNIMKALFALEDCRISVGATPLLMSPCHLNGENLGDFEESLCDAQRELPLMLVVTDETGETTPIDDVDAFAALVRGMANVYVADWSDDELREGLDELFAYGTPAHRYRCGISTVRVYRAHVDLDDERRAAGHPYFIKEQIRRLYGQPGEGLDDDWFANQLVRSLGRSIARDEHDILDLEDISRMSAREQTEKLRVRIQHMQQEADAREAARAASPEADKKVVELAQSVAEWQALAEEQDQESAELRQRVCDLQELADMTELMLEEAEKENNLLRGEVDRLSGSTAHRDAVDEAHEELDRANARAARAEAETAQLRQSAAQARRNVDAVDALEAIPTSLVELLELAEKLWASRLVVLEEAKRSARDFTQGDLQEEWEIIRSVATTLYDIYFGDDGAVGDVAAAYQDLTGFELSLRESKTTNRHSTMTNERIRIYRGEEVDITPHIKGRGRQKRSNAFRLHFYVDRENGLIVIGHAGSHLTTAGTQYVR